MCITLSFCISLFIKKRSIEWCNICDSFEKFYVYAVCFSRYFRNFSIILIFLSFQKVIFQSIVVPSCSWKYIDCISTNIWCFDLFVDKISQAKRTKRRKNTQKDRKSQEKFPFFSILLKERYVFSFPCVFCLLYKKGLLFWLVYWLRKSSKTERKEGKTIK